MAAGSDFSSIHGPSGASKKSNLEIFILPYDRYTDRYGRYGRYGRYCEVYTAPVRAAKSGPAAKEV